MTTMIRMLRSLLTALALVVLLGFLTRPDSGMGTVEIRFEPQVSGQVLVLNNQLYHVPEGDSFYLDVLRFYVSDVQLKGKGILYREQDSHHLIDAEESGSQTVVLKNVPTGCYEMLSFNIGTDSLTNVSGAMGGDLDPTKGMYWAWNSGYINAKIEGRSNACKTLHQAFNFHIGGYLPPNQTLRSIELPLKQVIVGENALVSVPVCADLGKFFSQIQLSQDNSVMIPSRQATRLADYFKNIFGLK